MRTVPDSTDRFTCTRTVKQEIYKDQEGLDPRFGIEVVQKKHVRTVYTTPFRTGLTRAQVTALRKAVKGK